MESCLEDTTNVYRTKHYIVAQVLDVKDDSVETTELCSHDTFFLRTKKRDAQYEELFRDRKRIDGKRLPSTMTARKYVE